MAEERNSIILDEEDGHKLQRIRHQNGSVEYLITSPGDDPNLRIIAKGDKGLDDIMVHWKKIHTMSHNKWRNSHFKKIEAEVKEMEKREKDKQEDLPLEDGEEDE